MKAEETELFTKYYTEWKGGGDRDQSYKNIPRFYYRVSIKYTTHVNPKETVVIHVILIVLWYKTVDETAVTVSP